MSRHAQLSLWLVVLLLAPVPLAYAQGTGKPAATAWRGDPVAGRSKSEEERCQECHGYDGNAQDIQDGIGNIGKFPRLAGQLPAYLLKQIGDFRNGGRHNDSMFIMARGLNELDAADIAAYFASIPTAREKTVVTPLGRRLYQEGDAARGIPACSGCHGETGLGRVEGDAIYPRLAGQYRRYLVKQLSEWRAGERKNSRGGIMNVVARPLADDEIEQLADFLAGL